MADARDRQAHARRKPATSTKPFKHSNGAAKASTKASLTDNFDTEVYGDNPRDKFAGYNKSIDVQDDADLDDDDEEGEDESGRRLIGQYTATSEQIGEWATGEAGEADTQQSREEQARIANRESDYQKRRFDRAFDSGDQSYKDVMQQRELEREELRVKRLIEEQETEKLALGASDDEMDGMEHQATLRYGTPELGPSVLESTDELAWEDAVGASAKHKETLKKSGGPSPTAKSAEERARRSELLVSGLAKHDREMKHSLKRKRRDDEKARKSKRSKWDTAPAETTGPKPAKTSSRWDQVGSLDGPETTNGASTSGPVQPVAGFGHEVAGRNAFLTDEELDALLPSKGFQILTPPPGYVRTAPARRPLASNSGGFMMQESVDARSLGLQQLPSEIPGVGDLQFFKNEDMQYFGKLVDGVDEAGLAVDELRDRKIMRLLLKVKNGTPPMRKTALRQITDNARAFGPGPLFDQILPLLMERTLEDQERHLLVKVIDRILYKLDDLVRPYIHKILVVIEPLLIDQDYYARIEGKEIITNLSKAAGLAHMIGVMRPDIDHADEYVRNTTARAFAVVASALGVPTILPFLKAVCRSKKSWQARHTGVKIVQHIAIQMGCAILPHLRGLVECVGDNLEDSQIKVRTITSLALAALAEAANPYGIESFDTILNALWTGARRQRGKALAGYLKAVGFIIPLMDEEYCNYYTEQIMEVLRREMATPDEEMKKVVLKVISQTAGGTGIAVDYIKDNILDDFFRNFWVRRMALDKRNYRQVVETTVDLGHKVGAGEIIQRIVGNLKDESEAFRKMSVETTEKLISAMGDADIDAKLEERLVIGMLDAFRMQSSDDIVLLNGFGTVISSLGGRCKDYMQRIVVTLLDRLQDPSAQVRQQAADLLGRIAGVMQQCNEDVLMNRVSLTLYENLGEEYPEVLGSILGALRSLVAVIGIKTMQPPIRDLLPRLTPILRNRHEKVQENTIDLVGRVADRGPEEVHTREWMRIVFELLDMLKAHKKGIRRAANNTFGFIAKAIGPQDVLATLLNNLRVQERQSRVCTAVAIGIVAETCAPFTVLPALMNEYRVPELNVQNGVVKAISFMFEYIGEMGKDYVYAVTPLLEDALIDRDQVHRQTAAAAVRHVALGVVGLGCEDALLHLLNLLIPNLFETSPHVIDRVIEGIDAIRVALGTGAVMDYIWAGLFHPARKVRVPYWRLYNEAYQQSADAMVPYYPVDDDVIDRSELTFWVV